MQRLLSVSLLIATTSCTYEHPVGRTVPPPAPGHFELRWATKLGGLMQEEPTAIVVAGDGDWFVAGTTHGSAADLSAGVAPQPPPPPQPSSSTPRGFVAKVSRIDGSLHWAALVEDLAVTSIRLATSGDGVIACGYGRAPDGAEQSFVRKYDGTGQLAWSHPFGAGSFPFVLACAGAPDGSVVVAGGFTGTIDLGTGPVAAAEPRPTEHPFRAADAFLLRLGSDGQVLGGRAFPAPGQQAFYDLVIDPDGEITALAYAWGTISFGGPTFAMSLDHSDPGAQARLFLRFTADGQHLASTALPVITHPVRSHVLLARQHDDLYVVVHDENGDAEARMTRFELDAAAGLLDTVTRAQRVSSGGQLASNGMTVAVVEGGSTIAGETHVEAYDAELVPLGGVALSGDVPNADVLGSDFRISHVAMAGSSVAVVGRFNWAYSFGGAQVWAHGAGMLGAGAYQLGSSDVVVVMLEWIED